MPRTGRTEEVWEGGGSLGGLASMGGGVVDEGT